MGGPDIELFIYSFILSILEQYNKKVIILHNIDYDSGYLTVGVIWGIISEAI